MISQIKNFYNNQKYIAPEKSICYTGYNNYLDEIMPKLLHWVGIAFFVLITACSKSDNNGPQKLSVIAADGQSVRHEWTVEIADTIEKAYRGLMGRFSLSENAGMLFDVNIVPRDMGIAFWMKDTPISLDMLFADENGVIFYIYENAVPNDITPIMSPTRPAAVLEINGGQAERFGIREGDIMHHPIFNN